MTALDALVRQGLQPGGLVDETTVVYISPLKASNDIGLNLDAPMAGTGRHGVSFTQSLKETTR